MTRPHPKKHKSRRKRHRTPQHIPPDVLVADPTAPHPVVSLLAYGPEAFIEQEITDLRQLPALLGQWPVTWINVEGLGDVEIIAKIGELFGLHRLTLEDILLVNQRPKVEQYANGYFIVSRMVQRGEQLETEQLSLFLGKDFILTFQEGFPGDSLEPVRDRIRKKGGRIREAGLDYLAYALLDAVIDGYFPVLEHYGEELEALEDEIVSQPSRDTTARGHEIKRNFLTLRRAIWPHREIFSALLREENPLITSETRLYLRDCYDHVTQIIDLVETYRELGSDLTDVYLSSLSHRTNETMRVLTIIATKHLRINSVV